MKARAVLFGLSLLTLAGCPQAPDARLEGVWFGDVCCVVNDRHGMFRVEGVRFAYQDANVYMDGVYTVDLSKTPAWIDLKVTRAISLSEAGPVINPQGKTLLGVYRYGLDDNLLMGINWTSEGRPLDYWNNGLPNPDQRLDGEREDWDAFTFRD